MNANPSPAEIAELSRQLAQVYGPFEKCPRCETISFMVEKDPYDEGEHDDDFDPFSDPQERTETIKKTCLACGYEQEIVTAHRQVDTLAIARHPYEIDGVKPGYSWSKFVVSCNPEEAEDQLQRWEAGGHEIVLANRALINGRLWLRGSEELFAPEE